MKIDADPDPDFYIWSGSWLLVDADADPGYQNDGDPDPQHCSQPAILWSYNTIW